MMRVHRLLSRKKLYCAGLAYGVGAIVFSGLVVPPFPAAADALGPAAETAHLYHYHVSAVFATLVAAGILLVAGVAASHGSFLLSLREAYRNLALFDVCAVVGGAGLTFAAGWLKEMGDVMRGRFFDQADFAADGQAILAQAGCALLLVLPVHAAVALCGDFVRRRILKALSPPSGRRGLEQTFDVEAALLRNATEVRQQDGLLARLERDLARLTCRYRGLAPWVRRGAAGQALRQAAQASEEKRRKAVARLAHLEAENERLRGELKILRKGRQRRDARRTAARRDRRLGARRPGTGPADPGLSRAFGPGDGEIPYGTRGRRDRLRWRDTRLTRGGGREAGRRASCGRRGAAADVNRHSPDA